MPAEMPTPKPTFTPVLMPRLGRIDRILASVPDLPGVMAYGDAEDAARRKVKSVALEVLADMIESGEDVPAPFKGIFTVQAERLAAKPDRTGTL